MKIKYYRDKKGRFKHKRRWVVALVLIGVLVLAFHYGGGEALVDDYVYSQPVVVEKIKVVDTTKRKVEKQKWEVVDRIEKCESKGYSEDDAIIIWDDNVHGTLKPMDKYSIGTFQFKKSTIIYYYKRLYGQKITPKQAVLVALDGQKARQLAYDILYQTKYGWKNWWNCAKPLKGRIEAYRLIK